MNSILDAMYSDRYSTHCFKCGEALDNKDEICDWCKVNNNE
ncbi:hypothetical protein BH18THE1_BH18THE1_09740 [soil metagenome]